MTALAASGPVAECAWLAPAAILATCALAGGGAFLLMSVIETRLRARDR